MNDLFKNKTFIIGFCISSLLFVLVNYISYWISYDSFLANFDGRNKVSFSLASYSIGFPFDFYKVIVGNPNGTYIDTLGFALDGLLGFTFSFLSGIFLTKFLNKGNNILD